MNQFSIHSLVTDFSQSTLCLWNLSVQLCVAQISFASLLCSTVQWTYCYDGNILCLAMVVLGSTIIAYIILILQFILLLKNIRFFSKWAIMNSNVRYICAHIYWCMYVLIFVICISISPVFIYYISLSLYLSLRQCVCSNEIDNVKDFSKSVFNNLRTPRVMRILTAPCVFQASALLFSFVLFSILPIQGRWNDIILRYVLCFLDHYWGWIAITVLLNSWIFCKRLKKLYLFQYDFLNLQKLDYSGLESMVSFGMNLLLLCSFLFLLQRGLLMNKFI